MLNSVAKYLWGGAGNESDYTDQRVLQEGHQAQDGEHQVAPVVEHAHDDDWVLVSNAEKENSNSPAQHHHHHNYLPHQHHPHHISYHHRQSHHSSHESLSQQSTAEVELLDEAASLVCETTDPCGHFPYLPDCDNKSLSDQEDNGLDSGVRPSSPESVFSACSGRSSATYRPRGVDSEAWVVAPPPCFTGSQCRSLSPLASSPLENLLIEHPSMSVYISQPAANLISSMNNHSNFQGFSVHVSGSTTAVPESDQIGNDENRETAAATAAEVAAAEARLHNTGLARRRQGEAAVHQYHMTPETVRKSQNSAQQRAVCVSQKNVSRQKCLRQNQIREIHAAPKGRVNRKNKQMRPSGFRSSRNPQRSNVPRVA